MRIYCGREQQTGADKAACVFGQLLKVQFMGMRNGLEDQAQACCAPQARLQKM